MRTPSALVVLATGAEEMEVTIVVDVLRRAGVTTVLAGLDGEAPASCSRGVMISPDQDLASVSESFELIVLPGGTEGADRLASATDLGERLGMHWAAGGLLGAICAAPIALQRHGIALGSNITSHLSVKQRLERDYRWCNQRVCEDGQLTTSQSPGSSFEFALTLARRLCGQAKHDDLKVQLGLP